MAKVIVTFRIMPRDVNVDLEKLEEDIRNTIKPEKLEREPIAFGLTAIRAIKLVDDAAGELENVENRIKMVENVGNVEVVEITRSL